MTKSKKTITFEPVIFLVISIITISVFIINKFFPNLNLSPLFKSVTSSSGPEPFNFKEPILFLRFFLYIFGTDSLSSWIMLTLLYLLLPEAENNYGTLLTLLMMILSTVFSGVLFACFGTVPFSGCTPIVFLLMSLRIISELKKKLIPLGDITGLIFFMISFVFDKNNIKEVIISMFICLAGGLAGSLVSFITVKKSSEKKKKTHYNNNDETIIGSIEL